MTRKSQTYKDLMSVSGRRHSKYKGPEARMRLAHLRNTRVSMSAAVKSGE